MQEFRSGDAAVVMVGGAQLVQCLLFATPLFSRRVFWNDLCGVGESSLSGLLCG